MFLFFRRESDEEQCLLKTSVGSLNFLQRASRLYLDTLNVRHHICVHARADRRGLKDLNTVSI